MKTHRFGVVPKKIVWIQMSGLSESQLPLMKFFLPSTKNKLALENVSCFGKTWVYNLFDIRPDSFSSFQTQLSGEKGSKKACKIFKEKPVWQHLASDNFESMVMEVEAQENTLLKAQECENEASYLSNVTFLKVEKAKRRKDINLFHSREKSKFEKGQVYYDQSCSEKGCFTPLSANFISAYERFTDTGASNFFLLRDYSFADYLQKGAINKAKSTMSELEKIVDHLLSKYEGSSDFLLLITSAAPLPIEFPEQGKKWERVERSGRNILYKNEALMAPVFSYGARSENFCGLYEEHELLPRLLSGSRKKGIEINISNPFD